MLCLLLAGTDPSRRMYVTLGICALQEEGDDAVNKVYSDLLLILDYSFPKSSYMCTLLNYM